MARSTDIIGTYGELVIPASGIYWGSEDQATGQNFTGASGIETLLGRRMSIRRQHYSWATGPASMPTAFETANDALVNPKVIHMVCQRGDGNFPVVNTGGGWSSTNTTPNALGHKGMQQIVDGDFDAKFTKQFNGLKTLKNPVLYNLWFEMNGAHNNYYSLAQGTGSTAHYTAGTGETHYVAAYRHVRGLADAAGVTINHGGNLLFVWCIQTENTTGWFEPYYPGDAYVDILAVDLYRRTFSSGTNDPTPPLGGGDNQFYLFGNGTMAGSSAVNRGSTCKPMMVAEAGYGNGIAYKDNGTGGDGLSYFKDSSPFVQDKLLATMKIGGGYENVFAYVHWNENGITNNIVNQSAASLTAYKRFANDPYCQLFFGTTGGGGGGTAPAVPVFDPASLPTNPTTDITTNITWTSPDSAPAFRWRLTTDGVVGVWNSTGGSTGAAFGTPVGHTYIFEVEAGTNTGVWSAPNTYTFNVVTSTTSVATPVIVVAPTASSGGSTGSTTAAFVWTEASAGANYRYFCKVDKPGVAGVYPATGSTELVFNVPGRPLPTGAYKFYVKAWDGSTFSTEATWTWTITAVTSGPKAPVFVQVPPDPDTNLSPIFSWTE